MSDADARVTHGDDDSDAQVARILDAVRQLRLEHGNHPCYDVIEAGVVARSQRIRQLHVALRAVKAIAAEGLT